jgi:hypothetical protein
MKLKHWQDGANGLLGVWIVMSPWALGFQDVPVAMTNAAVVGAALVAAALRAIFVPRAWEEWTEAVLGVWLIASPWLLGFSLHPEALMTTLLTGSAVMALALWTLLTDKDYGIGLDSLLPR